MDNAIVTALNADRPLVYCCVEIVFNSFSPPFTLRLLDGFGPGASLTFDSKTFYGSSDTYGSVGLPDGIQDAVAGEAGLIELMVYPPSDAAALDVQNAADENTEISVWGPGAINRSTGANIADPDLIFTGFVADAVLTLGQGSSVVSLQCVDGFARLLDRGDGFSANGPVHKSIRSGELGFDFVTEVERPLYWGSATPASSTGVIARARDIFRSLGSRN